jgi:hypothetical protein
MSIMSSSRINIRNSSNEDDYEDNIDSGNRVFATQRQGDVNFDESTAHAFKHQKE